MGFIGSIFGGIFGAHAAGKAAKEQSKASMYAADLERKSAQEALAFQKDVWGQTQKNFAPWLQAGGKAETQLSDLMSGGGFPDWNEQFQAPTNVTEQNDPGYKFRLDQGMQALQNSAAARGTLLSGATGKAIEQYGQDYASNEYANVYGRAFNEYSTRYNQFETNQANKFNRLSTLAGGGQVAAGQLGGYGQSAAGNTGNILLQSSRDIGNFTQNAAAARASGYIGQANALSGLVGGVQDWYNLQTG